MALSQSHEFHFVIAESMKQRLEELDMFKGLTSFSGIIVKILSLLSPIIKREHEWGEQRMSRYRHVSKDPTEEREHIHTYLPAKVYRELKLIHQDLNFYSIAQIVREFLEVFMVLVDEYGDDILQELDTIYKQWKKEVDATRLTLPQYLRQLWIIIQHLPNQIGLINVYDQYFSPFWIFRL